jgi:hypothetical protein
MLIWRKKSRTCQDGNQPKKDSNGDRLLRWYQWGKCTKGSGHVATWGQEEGLKLQWRDELRYKERVVRGPYERHSWRELQQGRWAAGKCGTKMTMKNKYTTYIGKAVEKKTFGDQQTYTRIILKWILRLQPRLKLVRMVPSGQSLWTRQWTFGFPNGQGFFDHLSDYKLLKSILLYGVV